MKAAAILGKRQAGLADLPTPEPKEDWALVKVHAAPMCAEYKGFLSGDKSEYLGHEAAGEVVEVAQSGRVKVGDRVVVMPLYPCGTCGLCVSGDYIHCRNAYDFAAFAGSPAGYASLAQYLLKPAWLLPRIPEGVSYERGALACCGLGPTFGAFESMSLCAFDTVLVTGLGPVGLGAVVNALYRGARVIAVESVPWRMERARRMGAHFVLDAAEENVLERIMEITGGAGVDKAVDCCGVPRAQRLCIDAARRKGMVAFVGEAGELTVRVSDDLIRKGLTLIGSWHYNLAAFDRVMQVIMDSPVIDLLISHTLPMSRIQEAMELSASHECAKIILNPWE